VKIRLFYTLIIFASIASFSGYGQSPVISYPSPTYNIVVNTPVSLIPVNTGGTATGWGIFGTLPAGLTFNSTTGVIAGTPTAVTASASYIVWASSDFDYGTTLVSIGVVGAAGGVPIINYNSAVNNYTVGAFVFNSLTPSNTGSAATSWAISPATLPAGLSFSTTTGAITGICTAVFAATTYTITATNAVGIGTTSISISVGTTFIWIGGNGSTGAQWTNANNWSRGAAPNLPTDDIEIGVSTPYSGQQPIILAATTVNSITFGPNTGNTAPTLTITGAGLTISNSLMINNSAIATVTGTGNLDIAAGGILNVNGTGKLVQSLTGGFTLKSSILGSASLGQLTAGTVTGIFNVERFITGGVGHRGYMLLSSPVYKAAVGTNKVYDLHYLTNASAGMFLTGTTGFDKGGNPSLYLYREDVPYSNAGFTAGNFQGVSTFNNTNVYDYNVNNGPTTYNMPAGNGYMVFFRGNRSAATLLQETVSTFTAAPTVTLVASGTLNTGSITVRDWFNPASGNLSFTTAIANAAVRGFNLVGNPYASSIDWENFSSTTSTAGIYGPNVSNIVYEYNIITHNYDTYQVGGAHTNNGTRTIVSGQGFFVKADTTLAALTFNETAKSTTQNIGSNLFMTTRADIEKVKRPAANQYLLLEMGLDAVNKDNTYIGFSSTAKPQYVFNEDALYNPGTGKVSLSSLSGDSQLLAINKMPYPTTVSDTIRLKVGAQAAGVYTLKMTNTESIPDLYEIWLKDAYTKDTLNMRQNPVYTFNVDFSNATTYGASRFSLIIRQNYTKRLHLLNFDADKITGGVQLNWKTKNEKSYTVFTVERSVDKGITFSAIGGFTSSDQGSYSLADNNPLNGENRYRLKLMDVNGDITYSKAVTISYLNSTAGDTHNLLVYPNPVKSMLYLLITNTNLTSGFSAEQVTSISSLLPLLTAKPDQYSITIVNNLGAVVKKAATNVPQWQTDVSNLLPGPYVIQVISKTGKRIIGQTTFIKL
jgi:hypothetical protein